MTCRHEDGDPDCSSTSSAESIRAFLSRKHVLARAGLEEAAKKLAAAGVNPRGDTELVDLTRRGSHVILRVKVVDKVPAPEVLCVYFDLSEAEIVKWRGGPPILFGSTPRSPAAIFPATTEGMENAEDLITAMTSPGKEYR